MNRASRRRNLARAFSLVELLVVLALIALLLAVFLPTFAMVRRQLVRLRCQTNLAKCHRIMMQYAANQRGYLPCFAWMSSIAEWDEETPGSGALDGGTPKGRHLMGDYLKSYGAGPETFSCPADPAYQDPANWKWQTWDRFRTQTAWYCTFKIIDTPGYAFFVGSDKLCRDPYDRRNPERHWPRLYDDFISGMPFPKLASDAAGNPPIAADELMYNDSQGRFYGFNHSPRDDTVEPAGGGSTLFLSGAVQWYDWADLEQAGPMYVGTPGWHKYYFCGERP